MFAEDLHIIIAFVIAILVLLGLDLFIVGRKSHEITMKEAGIWTGVFIAASLAFAGYINYDQGSVKSVEFLNAYVIEKMLSVDNLFVFILVFKYFTVPKEYQHKALFYGIIGAIVLRAIFIFAGVELINLTNIIVGGYEINILLGLFGLFLAYAGIKSFIASFKDEDDDTDFKDSPGAKMIRWIFPRISEDYDKDKFFTVKNGIKYATPLLVVVGVIEFTDLLFAVDSIPAIFSVSKDPFILYSSNIFAILGLRSMYFLLSGLLPMFKYLGFGVAIILFFIGIKMIIAPVLHVPSDISLYVILGVLITSVGLSLLNKE